MFHVENIVRVSQVKSAGMLYVELCFLLLTLSNVSSAEIVTWEASGNLISVSSSGGFITEFPAAMIGTPFNVSFTFDAASVLSSATTGTNGTRYRYIDSLLSVELTVDGVGLDRAKEGFVSIDIWDDFTNLGSIDPASDGFNLIWGVTSPAGGFAQLSLILRGPENLDVFSGPGLPTEPSSLLTSFSTHQFQLIDSDDSIIGDINSVTVAVGPSPAGAQVPLQTKKLFTPDGDPGDEYGILVSMSNDTIIVSAGGRDEAAEDSGAAYVYVRQGNDWVEQTKLLQDNGEMDDWFGSAVALDGDTAVIGSWREDDLGTQSGAAYVFVRTDDTWSEQDKLFASNGAEGGLFGRGVAISGDTIVVGSRAGGHMGMVPGTAYVFVRNGDEWTEQTKLFADDGVNFDRFGRAIAIEDDTVVIGAWLDDDTAVDSGSAYVFVRNGTNWSQQAHLSPDTGGQSDNIGYSIDLSGDTVIIGAINDDEAAVDAGAAYIFVRDGTNWTQQEKFIASDAQGGDLFGVSVAKFTAEDAEDEARFGRAATIDGNFAVIGAWFDDNDVVDTGSAYVFLLSSFEDVPPDYWAVSFIESLAEAGITSGCGNGNYCPEDSVTRAQMAVFLERGMNGSGFSPPAASGNVFLDVAANDFAASFIEQLASDAITSGCGNNNYCPLAQVTRDQMAVFLLRAKYGSSYSPPAATGVFGDVDLGHWAAHWIEQLAAEGITAGCGGGNYCPENPVTRAQMAVFLVRTFGL